MKSQKKDRTHLQAARTVGMMAGHATRRITEFWDSFRHVRSRIGISLLSREDVQRIIAEQLASANPEQQDLTLQQYDRRMKAMSEALLALQEKIAELQASGHLNAQTMSQAIGEVQSEEHFNDDERNIFANILRQNIVLQKPELVKSEIPAEVK